MTYSSRFYLLRKRIALAARLRREFGFSLAASWLHSGMIQRAALVEIILAQVYTHEQQQFAAEVEADLDALPTVGEAA